MPNGGTISITCENVEIKTTDPDAIKKGKYIKISICDSGDGIPPDDLKRIFDPYFTTKTDGSGLGLTTVYSVITKHNGYLTVESELGKGSCFYIYLPAVAKTPGKIPATSATGLEAKETILVMDDDKAVSKIAGKMLKKMGFEVEFADDGARAIEMYAETMRTKNPYIAILMDLTIPGGIGGKQAIQELLKIDPDVKAIVSSGYSNDLSLSEYDKYG